MKTSYIVDERATGIARVFRGAQDLPLLRDDEHVFPPDDNWTLALAEALVKKAEQGELDGQKILELGCGSGVNILGLHAVNHFFRMPPSLIALDITTESVEFCCKMASQYDMGDVEFLQSNLLAGVTEQHLAGVDKVFACLPQVLWDEQSKGRPLEPREMADYYTPPEGDVRREDAYGLGLLARALEQVKSKIPEASVLFNVAGRQGPLVEKLFVDHGFPNMKKVVDRVIPNDPDTSLSSFAAWERQSGESCVFYEDFGRHHQINAAQAEEHRLGGREIYHDLFVIDASMG